MSVFIAKLYPLIRDESLQQRDPFSLHGVGFGVFLYAPVCHQQRFIGKIVNMWQDDASIVWIKAVTISPIQKETTHVSMCYGMCSTGTPGPGGIPWRTRDAGCYHVKLILEADAWWEESKVIDVTKNIKQARGLG